MQDLEAMVADTSEEAIWTLADAVVAGDEAETLRVAELLVAQGEALPRIVYSLAPRLRQALRAAAELEAGRPAGEVAKGLSMHPYAAKMLVSKVKGRTPEDLDASIRALADLELWSRGGSDYAEGVALTLALRRAIGLGAGRHRAPLPGRCGEAALLGGGAEGGRRGTSCARRCCGAGRPSGRPCRSARRVPCAPGDRRRRFPDCTAASSRLKCVFTELRKRRFSGRSRSVRAFRFFCEAILAMKRPAVRGRRQRDPCQEAKRIEQ